MRCERNSMRKFWKKIKHVRNNKKKWNNSFKSATTFSLFKCLFYLLLFFLASLMQKVFYKFKNSFRIKESFISSIENAPRRWSSSSMHESLIYIYQLLNASSVLIKSLDLSDQLYTLSTLASCPLES